MVMVVVVLENNGLMEDTYESKLQVLGSNTTEDLVSYKLTKGAKGTQTSLFAFKRLSREVTSENDYKVMYI